MPGVCQRVLRHKTEVLHSQRFAETISIDDVNRWTIRAMPWNLWRIHNKSSIIWIFSGFVLLGLFFFVIASVQTTISLLMRTLAAANRQRLWKTDLWGGDECGASTRGWLLLTFANLLIANGEKTVYICKRNFWLQLQPRLWSLSSSKAPRIFGQLDSAL